jgi:hypothetical protein
MDIRLYREGDEEGIRRLFALCFGKEMSSEHWFWKYKTGPWGSSGAVVLDNGQIVAHYGGLGMRFYSKGRIYKAFEPCDVMTHPKYRARLFARRGAMVRAGEVFYEKTEMDFAFGFPSERHAILGTKQLGYTEHGFVAVMKKGRGGFRSRISPLGRFKLEEGWDFIKPGDIDSIWEESKDTYGLSIVKDSRYIFWRYRDNPSKRYAPLALRRIMGKRPSAYAVTSVDGGVLSINDFFAKEKRIIKPLISSIENLALKKGIDKIQLWVNPAEEVFSLLKASGYEQDKGIPYIFKIVNTELTPSFLFKSYCYRPGDYDAG